MLFSSTPFRSLFNKGPLQLSWNKTLLEHMLSTCHALAIYKPWPFGAVKKHSCSIKPKGPFAGGSPDTCGIRTPLGGCAEASRSSPGTASRFGSCPSACCSAARLPWTWTALKGSGCLTLFTSQFGKWDMGVVHLPGRVSCRLPFGCS